MRRSMVLIGLREEALARRDTIHVGESCGVSGIELEVGRQLARVLVAVHERKLLRRPDRRRSRTG